MKKKRITITQDYLIIYENEASLESAFKEIREEACGISISGSEYSWKPVGKTTILSNDPPEERVGRKCRI